MWDDTYLDERSGARKKALVDDEAFEIHNQEHGSPVEECPFCRERITKPAAPKTIITLIPINSSALKSVGYDANSRILRAEFNNGALWDYADVSPEKYEALLGAESVGRHFHAFIKTHHVGTRVEKQEEAAA